MLRFLLKHCLDQRLALQIEGSGDERDEVNCHKSAEKDSSSGLQTPGLTFSPFHSTEIILSSFFFFHFVFLMFHFMQVYFLCSV